MARNKKSSPPLRTDQIPTIKRRLENQENQHDIAADYKVNQGRISEIKTGKKFADIPAAPMI
jgi:hypothetical protein